MRTVAVWDMEKEEFSSSKSWWSTWQCRICDDHPLKPNDSLTILMRNADRTESTPYLPTPRDSRLSRTDSRRAWNVPIFILAHGDNRGSASSGSESEVCSKRERSGKSVVSVVVSVTMSSSESWMGS
ncbi:hypothetical protein JCM33374_g4917 [Metschnikowia sp. JCM 33374]|nr:hypothetical protein JCM33374_g4917 [Metschnikowia sp. JCM 33374]